MVAALELWRRTGEERWREAWLDSADWLLGEWQETLWVQDLYGEKRQFTGAGHGFASNAFVLLAGRDLLGDRGDAVTDRIRAVLLDLAVEEHGVAQWFPLAGVETGRRPVQWCHGSPGIVTSLAGLPADEETDRILAAGGELTWRAGPLTKGAGLCHGAAGNAHAFLSLYSRSGDERWLDRARAFAMDAVTGAERRTANGERPRPLHPLHRRHRRRAPTAQLRRRRRHFPIPRTPTAFARHIQQPHPLLSDTTTQTRDLDRISVLPVAHCDTRCYGRSPRVMASCEGGLGGRAAVSVLHDDCKPP
jgi:hypothetical protein